MRKDLFHKADEMLRRKVVELREYELSYHQIQQRLGVSAATINKLLNRTKGPNGTPSKNA